MDWIHMAQGRSNDGPLVNTIMVLWVRIFLEYFLEKCYTWSYLMDFYQTMEDVWRWCVQDTGHVLKSKVPCISRLSDTLVVSHTCHAHISGGMWRCYLSPVAHVFYFWERGMIASENRSLWKWTYWITRNCPSTSALLLTESICLRCMGECVTETSHMT
jgi:hypothetical protein